VSRKIHSAASYTDLPHDIHHPRTGKVRGILRRIVCSAAQSSFSSAHASRRMWLIGLAAAARPPLVLPWSARLTLPFI
jgi:hypothetical protein